MMIRLVPMTEEEFDRYLERAVPDYAQAHVVAGDCDPGEALALAKADYESLLPLGLGTEGQFLFSIFSDEFEHAVGMLWFEVRSRNARRWAFLYDFFIEPSHRRRGYGRAAMQALELAARERGAGHMNLNVFGGNRAARALYERQGYAVASVGMTKDITGAA